MRGRKADPKAKRDGTARHRKATDIAPPELSQAFTQQAAVNIPLPASLPDEAGEVWQHFCAELARHELRPTDLPMLEMCVVAAVRHAQASAHIKEHGLFLDTPFGPMKNPHLTIEKDSAATYLKLSAALGLSPEARIRLDLMQVAGQSLLHTLAKELDDATRPARRALPKPKAKRAPRKKPDAAE